MIKKIYRLMGVFALVLSACMTSFAQRQQVSGTIKDGVGTPMPGVNVLIKGTSTGTSTDANGKFTLEGAPNEILQISFIGYKPQEMPIGSQTNFEIVLEEDVNTLSEIVVIGYGEQKKALNTGANLRVKGEDIQKLSTNNVLQALQGQTPGVQITTTSGQPGSDIRVVIRGQGSINGSGPLYVVDGVLMSDIKFLSPSDIESIDVMKDAASAAIYGSQGANGVVLITTKRGKSGKSQLTLDAFYGVQNVARKMPMLNAQEYAVIMNEAAVNSGVPAFFTDDQIAKIGAGATDWSAPRLDANQIKAMKGGTNWVDKIFDKNVPTQNYTLGLTGGSDNSTYSSALSYQSQGGIIGGKANSYYQRYNFRFNSDHKLYGDVLRFGQTLNLAYTTDYGIQVGGIYGNSVLPALTASPFLPMYDSTGNFWTNPPNSKWNPGEANPYGQMVLGNQSKNNQQRIVGNIYLELQPIKGLKVRSQLSMDASNSESHTFTPVYRLSQYTGNDTTRVTQNMGRSRRLIWDNVMSYSINIKNDHHFEAMAGTSAIYGTSNGMYGSNYNLTFSTLDKAWLNNSLNKTKANKMGISGGPGDDERVLSYFGRLHYSFRETYLLNMTFRADGSSNFARGHRWGYFPSVSAGWVVTNENFMSGLSSIFDQLKLRASWGQVGNRNIPAYRYLSPLTFDYGNYPFGTTEGSLTPGAYQKRLSNPNVKWETSQQTDFGFDAIFLQGRLTASFDWYTKDSKGWLVQPPVLATAGADGPFLNAGNVTNKGIEMMLSYSSEIGSLRYTVSANGAYNSNKVNQIPTADGIIYGETNALFVNSEEFYRAQSGQPLGYFYGYKTNGIFQSYDEINSYRSSEGKLIQPNAKPGDLRYVDTNGNGVIDANDKTKIGNPNPKYTFGFNVQLYYKGFDFTAVGNGVAGNDIAQAYRNPGGYQNYDRYILNRWHGPGTSNTVPRLDLQGTNYNRVSDIYIHKGDFLRVSNVTLGYDFTRLVKLKAFSQLRLYASALNLFTFTKYTGMDPEIGYGPSGDRGKYASGIDLGYYPRPRTYLVGLNVKF